MSASLGMWILWHTDCGAKRNHPSYMSILARLYGFCDILIIGQEPECSKYWYTWRDTRVSLTMYVLTVPATPPLLTEKWRILKDISRKSRGLLNELACMSSKNISQAKRIINLIRTNHQMTCCHSCPPNSSGSIGDSWGHHNSLHTIPYKSNYLQNICEK